MYVNKLKIFVSAYACEPDLGSEIGVGWHCVLEMAKYFEVWVLTRQSNRHSIEPWMAEHPESGPINFLYFDLPKWARFWKKGLRGVHLYYCLWQYFSNEIVQKTMRENGIDVFHHLTYGNILWNVSSYGQKQCFVWGPVGGLETIPVEYSKYFSCKARVKEWIRRCFISSAKWNMAFRQRCDNANLILCKTDITRKLISGKNQIKTRLFTDVAMADPISRAKFSVGNDRINYLMVGRLDAWRGFDIAIEAFARAIQKHQDMHLTIVGKGEDKDRLQSLIQDRRLENDVTLCGEVTRLTYEAMLADTDVVVNASLKEAAVTVAFDSIANRKPLICLDTTGHTRLWDGCGAIVIPSGNRNKVIGDLTEAILQLTVGEERAKLSRQAQDNSRYLTWEEHGKQLRDIINQTYDKYRSEKHIYGR